MVNYNKHIQKERKKIFYILKALSMLLALSPLITDIYNRDNYFTIAIALSVFGVATNVLIYFFNRTTNLVKIIDVLLFTALFNNFVFISYEYKFIILLNVVAFTIGYGLKYGLITSATSTFLIIVSNAFYFKKFLIFHDFILALMLFIVAFSFGYLLKILNKQIKRLINYANVDGLTGCYNQRYFYHVLNSFCVESRKSGNPLTLLVIDIDNFKNYNDIYGHLKGDELLKALISLIKQSINKTDIMCRYGGDEFCIIMPNTYVYNGFEAANKLREIVYNCYYTGQEYLPNKKLTISIGVAAYNDDCESHLDLVKNADSALYKAKLLRKNKVVIYSNYNSIMKTDDFSERIKPLKSLLTIINSRDAYTYNHSKRVVEYCSVMADFLKLDLRQKKLLLYSAFLHDLGKINISKEILMSDKTLTKQQFDEIKRHPELSAEIISSFEGFEEISVIIKQHHEKYDGSGYPSALKGEDISYLSRILTIADSFDAMTNQRTYQKIKSFDEAINEITKCKGSHFDPQLADAFINSMKAVVNN